MPEATRKSTFSPSSALALLFGETAEELISPWTIFFAKIYIFMVIWDGILGIVNSQFEKVYSFCDSYVKNSHKIFDTLKLFVKQCRELKVFIFGKVETASIEIQTEFTVIESSNSTARDNRADKVHFSRVNIP